jgi:hypothetical protein
VLTVVIVAVVVSIAAFAVYQRQALGAARTDAHDRIAGAPPDLADAGQADWQEVMGALVVEPGAGDENDLLAPLALRVEETQKVTPNIHGPHKDIRGRTKISGTRHGRRVDITVKEGVSRVNVGPPGVAAFTAAVDGRRLVAGGGAPDGVVSALESLGESKRWRGVRVSGGDHGVRVTRDEGPVDTTIYHDLWLAERLIEANR